MSGLGSWFTHSLSRDNIASIRDGVAGFRLYYCLVLYPFGLIYVDGGECILTPLDWMAIVQLGIMDVYHY